MNILKTQRARNGTGVPGEICQWSRMLAALERTKVSFPGRILGSSLLGLSVHVGVVQPTLTVRGSKSLVC